MSCSRQHRRLEGDVRIGIDLSLIPGERAGGGQYAYQLAAALARVDQRHHYCLYPVFYYIVHPDYPRAEFPTSARVTLAFRNLPPALVRWLWRAEGSARIKEWLLGSVDVVHSTTFCVPALSPRKRLVATIYDLSFVFERKLLYENAKKLSGQLQTSALIRNRAIR